MDNLLAEGIRESGISASKKQIDLLLQYAAEIESWNKHLNLVKASGEQLIVKHILDSLAGLPALLGLENRRTCADVGSGAGLPGIPLSVFMPDSTFTLIERSSRKALFLRSCASLLKLKNVSILESNLREVRSTFEIVLFRAFTKLCDVRMREIIRIAGTDGTIVAYKGKYAKIQHEIESNPEEYANLRVIPLEIPFLREERHLVLFSARRRSKD